MLIKNRKTGEERIISVETWQKYCEDNRSWNYQVLDNELMPERRPVPQEIVSFIEANKYETKADIMLQLEEKGIDYDKKMTKEQLKQLLYEQ